MEALFTFGVLIGMPHSSRLVLLFSKIGIIRLINYPDRHISVHPIHPLEISARKLPEHQDNCRRWRSMPTSVSSLRINYGHRAD